MYKGEVSVEQSCLESFLKTAEELKVKGLSESAILDSDGVDDAEHREFEDKTDDMVAMGDNSDISEGSPLLSDLNQDSELGFKNIDPSRRLSSRIMQTPAKKEPAKSKSVRNNQGMCRSVNSQTLAAKRSSIYGTKLTEEWKSGQKKKHQDKIKEPSSEKRKSGRGEATSSNRTKQDDRAGIDGDPHLRGTDPASEETGPVRRSERTVGLKRGPSRRSKHKKSYKEDQIDDDIDDIERAAADKIIADALGDDSDQDSDYNPEVDEDDDEDIDDIVSGFERGIKAGQVAKKSVSKIPQASKSDRVEDEASAETIAANEDDDQTSVDASINLLKIQALQPPPVKDEPESDSEYESTADYGPVEITPLDKTIEQTFNCKECAFLHVSGVKSLIVSLKVAK